MHACIAHCFYRAIAGESHEFPCYGFDSFLGANYVCVCAVGRVRKLQVLWSYGRATRRGGGTLSKEARPTKSWTSAGMSSTSRTRQCGVPGCWEIGSFLNGSDPLQLVGYLFGQTVSKCMAPILIALVAWRFQPHQPHRITPEDLKML